jgi:pyruvate/2-oxoglutarate dehydrogenase complex dihydrolipoamide dehydrogenase (E3) component
VGQRPHRHAVVLARPAADARVLRRPGAEQLGAAATGAGPLAADAVEVDPMLHTSVPDLSAAGDLSSQVPSVANAVATGSSAAAMIVGGLMSEAHGLAPVGADSDSAR